MDAGHLTFFGFPIEKDKKRDHFSYWHCALIEMAQSVFFLVHFLATRGHLFGHNSAVCCLILMKFSG